MRLTCPTCETNYAAGRCGVADVLADAEAKHLAVTVTVVCPICASTFDTHVHTEHGVDVAPGTWRTWWQPVSTPTKTRKVATRVR